MFHLNKGNPYIHPLPLIFLSFACLIPICTLWTCTAKRTTTMTATTTTTPAAKTYQARTFPNDPLNVHQYQLANGIRVLISPYPASARVFYTVIIHAGARHEPDHATGLAHYLEHMMFKGTDRLGTRNWQAEQPYLEQMAELYEQLRTAQSDQQRQQIYHQIDSINQMASQYAIPGEFEALFRAMGGDKLNATTIYDWTAYHGEFPANELERWARLESERLRMVVPRLFNLELEAVFEEFNMRFQDWDVYRVWDAIVEELFKGHPYARPVIGYAQHIRYPSIRAMQDFFHKWYVGKNMTICLSGDINPDSAIQILAKWFEQLPTGNPPEIAETLFAKPFYGTPVREVWSPQPEYVMVAWRTPTYRMKDKIAPWLVAMYVLSNEFAGILDMDLIHEQKVLKYRTYDWQWVEGGLWMVQAYPRENQSLEEVYQHVLKSVQRLAQGNFPKWLIPAAIRNLRLDLMERWESAEGRVETIFEAVAHGISWQDFLHILQDLQNVTYEDVVAIAREYLLPGHVVVYKRQGEPKDRVLLPKPPFTPVNSPNHAESQFAHQWKQMHVPPPTPHFVNFQIDIQYLTLNTPTRQIPVWFVPNTDNEIFRIELVFPFGYVQNPTLEVAFNLMEHAGTANLSSRQFREALFQHALDFSAHIHPQSATITLTGLKDQMQTGLELLYSLLTEPSASPETFHNLIKDLIKQRENQRKSPRALLFALSAYIRYGKHNPYTLRLSSSALNQVSLDTALAGIRNLLHWNHYILITAPLPPDTIISWLKAYYENIPPQPLPNQHKLQTQPTQPGFYFVPFDQVQGLVLRLCQSAPFSLSLYPFVRIYREYYGLGLGSITFKEIREKRGLAYATSSGFIFPHDSTQPLFHFFFASAKYDKVLDVLQVAEQILRKPVLETTTFQTTLKGLQQEIATHRLRNLDLLEHVYYWKIRMHINQDPHHYLYEQLPHFTLEQFQTQFHQYIANQSCAYALVGNPNLLPMQAIQQTFGEIHEFQPEQLIP